MKIPSDNCRDGSDTDGNGGDGDNITIISEIKLQEREGKLTAR